jgi:hypothetical protein
MDYTEKKIYKITASIKALYSGVEISYPPYGHIVMFKEGEPITTNGKTFVLHEDTLFVKYINKEGEITFSNFYLLNISGFFNFLAELSDHELAIYTGQAILNTNNFK